MGEKQKSRKLKKKNDVKSRASQDIVNDDEGSSVTADDTLSVPLLRVSLRIKRVPELYQRMGIKSPDCQFTAPPSQQCQPMSPKMWSSSSFLFIFLFKKKTPHSVLFCGMAIFVHLCWTFRVLYLGPILSSFTESEKTLPRNHLRLWPSRHLLRMCFFLAN